MMPKPTLFSALAVLIFSLTLALPHSVAAGEKHALINVAELLEMRQKTPLTIIEIVAPDRGAPASHILGARLSRFKADGWVVDYAGLPGMLPPADKLSKLGERLGITPNDIVVLVPVDTDTHGYAAATRAFWTLRMMGHENLHLLNGGLAAYRASGARLTESVSEAAKRTQRIAPYPSRGFTDRWITESGGVYDGDDYQTAPLDIRSSDQSQGYGTHPLVQSPGTIYGAFNVPPVAFVREGQFRSTALLRETMDDVIGKPPGPIVVFSDIGYRAAIGWFAIHEILGFQDVRLYDGGYVEWDDLGYETYDARNDMGDSLG